MLRRTSAALLLLAGVAYAGDAVPVHEEPLHHLVLERYEARILDVRIPAETGSDWHVHANDIFYAVLDGSDIWAEPRDGERIEVHWKSGHLSDKVGAYETPQTHRVGNNGSGEFRLIALESLNEANDHPLERGRVAQLGAPAVEDSRFRAHRVELAPGEIVDSHGHEYPLLILQMSGGKIELREGDAKKGRALGRGIWVWREAGEKHGYTNTGDTPVTLAEIEVR